MSANMTSPWLKQALVGVDGSALLPNEALLADLHAAIAARHGDPAAAFACALGALSACKLAAMTFGPAPPALTAPALADAQALPREHPWTAMLASCFAAGPLRLQFEACIALTANASTLAHALLPLALEAGMRSVALRAVLLPVIGHRGRWLAQFNSDWSYALEGLDAAASANDPRQWDVGSLAQRVAYLQQVRATDPAAARALLQAALGELPAKERLALVEVMRAGLGDDDETLLQPLLKDRGREVRQLAASLLALLPQSAHAKQLVAWLTPLLTSKRGLLLGKSWQIDAPAGDDPTWAGAIIDSKRPQHESLGERAWWLYQIVRQVPLRWWVMHTGMHADELVAWAAKTDWKDALYRGWRERVEAGDIDWIEAMLASRAKEFGHDWAGLLALLPPEARERHWPQSLDKLASSGALGDVIASCALGATLSEPFSRVLVADLQRWLESDALRQDYTLRAHVLELAAIVHPAALGALQTLPRSADETPALAECLDELRRILAARRLLHSPQNRTHPELR